MDYVANWIRRLGMDVKCPNLLEENECYSYEEEKEAYANFMTNIGIEKSVLVIEEYINELKATYKHVYLVGYSVGATIAWLCSGSESISGVIGYYGSRIRDYVRVEPQCPTMLLFSEGETSFQVEMLTEILRKKEKVDIHTFPVQHGYANPYSPFYSEYYGKQSLKLMEEFLKDG